MQLKQKLFLTNLFDFFDTILLKIGQFSTSSSLFNFLGVYPYIVVL
jgi:hypothetical protein